MYRPQFPPVFFPTYTYIRGRRIEFLKNFFVLLRRGKKDMDEVTHL